MTLIFGCVLIFKQLAVLLIQFQFIPFFRSIREERELYINKALSFVWNDYFNRF